MPGLAWRGGIGRRREGGGGRRRVVGAAGTCASAAAGRVVVVVLVVVGQAWRDDILEKAGAKKQVDKGQAVGRSGFGVGKIREKSVVYVGV